MTFGNKQSNKQRKWLYTPNGKKYTKCSQWKQVGIKFDSKTHADEIYKRYVSSTHCEFCNREYKSDFDRCLDHCHRTGKPRYILCRSCNSFDNWKKPRYVLKYKIRPQIEKVMQVSNKILLDMDCLLKEVDVLDIMDKNTSSDKEGTSGDKTQEGFW